MKTETDQIAQDVQKSIDEVKALVAGAAKNKALAAAREDTQGMITKWETDLASIKEKLQVRK